MIRLAWTPARSDAEVTKWPTGYVTAALGGSRTDGRQELRRCTLAQAVHAALATKLAYATRFSPCILKWLLSGMTAEMKAPPATIQLTPIKKSGGATVSVLPFKLASMTVPDSGSAEWLEAQKMCYAVHHACLSLTLALL